MTDLRTRLSASAAIAKRVFGGQPPQAATAAGAVFLGRYQGDGNGEVILEAAMREALIAAKTAFGQPVDAQAVAVLLQEMLGGAPSAEGIEALRVGIEASLAGVREELARMRGIVEAGRKAAEPAEAPKKGKAGGA